MNVSELCNKNAVQVSQQDSLLEVARLMRQQQVSSVIVIDKSNGRVKPEGIITDRDLVEEVLAARIDPSSVTAGDLLISELVCVLDTHNMWDALKRMEYFGVRQAPVVDVEGYLVGLLSIDESLPLLSKEFSEIVKLMSNQLSDKNKSKTDGCHQ